MTRSSRWPGRARSTGCARSCRPAWSRRSSRTLTRTGRAHPRSSRCSRAAPPAGTSPPAPRDPGASSSRPAVPPRTCAGSLRRSRSSSRRRWRRCSPA
ncbi:hypothetical protein ACFPRL_14775 [Pseudoclavibacter helvolus]